MSSTGVPIDRIIELGVAILTATGAGAVGAEVVRRWKSREERRGIEASTAKTSAEADALLIDSVAGSVASLTGSLRQEIDRLQTEAGDLRDRATTLEADLRVALARISEMERALATAEARITELLVDLERVRGERDLAHGRIEQLEGEIRQLKAIADAAKRAAST